MERTRDQQTRRANKRKAQTERGERESATYMRGREGLRKGRREGGREEKICELPIVVCGEDRSGRLNSSKHLEKIRC